MSILSFLTKKPVPVPSQVSTPARVQGTTFHAPNSNVGTPGPVPNIKRVSVSSIKDIPPPLEAITAQLPTTGILQRLHAADRQLPESVPFGTWEDTLAVFAIDPAQLVDPTMEANCLWEEVLNGMMKNVLGWADQPVCGLVRRGEFGLSGLLRFIEYFMLKRGVSAGLFEGKLSVLMSEIDNMLVSIFILNNDTLMT